MRRSIIHRAARWAVTAISFTLAAPPATGQVRDTVRADSAVRLPEIFITATRSEQGSRAGSPATASIDTATAADRAASRVAADLLRDTPGVHVQQTSAGQGAVVLRGLVGNQVLLLVDGIPLNNGTYRDGPGQYLATIDPETIDRLDVLRGPASVLYGSDAQGGVLNVITQPHPLRMGWSLAGAGHVSSANAGTRVRLSTGYAAGNLRIAGGVTLQQAGDLRAGGDVGAQRPTGFGAFGLDTRVTYTPTPLHRLTVALQHFALDEVPRYDRYVTFRAPAAGPDAEHVYDPQTRQLAYARHAYRPGTPGLRALTTTASLAVQREGRRRQRLVSGQPASTIEYTRDDVYTPGLSVVGESRFEPGDRVVALTWGAEAYRDVMASWGEITDLATRTATPLTRATAAGPLPAGRYPDGATMERVGVFVEADVALVSRLSLEAGGRWSGFRTVAEVGTDLGGRAEQRTDALTGQTGLVARVAEPVSLALRLAQGFRAPNLYDLTNVGPVPGGVVVPNSAVGPERSLSYEAGIRIDLERTAVDLVAYRTLIDDFIDRVPATFRGDTLLDGERVFQGRNVGDARVWGVEAMAVHRAGPVEARGTLLYTRGEQTLGDGTDEPMAKIPPLAGHARLRWRGAQGRWWIGYELRWAARQDRLSSRDLLDPRIEPGGTPGYAVHSVLAGATLGTLTLSAGLENLGDVLYRTHASGVDAPGRHVWVGIAVVQGW
ncbi:MAG: TonB-dependent receptor [Gemmatimonadota bacterium]|nr:TonB-dependent receptor [Gemmatimonadota bacterium]